MPAEFSLALEPVETIAHFSKKKIVETQRWDDLKREAHAKAFTVARSAGYDILGDIYNSLLDAQKNGESFDEWKTKLEPLLQKKGWIGTKEDADGSVIELGTPRRLETIYQTNIQSAYMAGQWKGIWENKKNRPYLMYDAVQDAKTRVSHSILDGRVFSVDDPFWDTHYPPNGYRCRCKTIALDDRDLQELGKSVETPPPLETIKTVNSKTGEVYETKAYRYKDAKGDPVLAKPDVGFDYNVGAGANYKPEQLYHQKVSSMACKEPNAKTREVLCPFADAVKKGYREDMKKLLPTKPEWDSFVKRALDTTIKNHEEKRLGYLSMIKGLGTFLVERQPQSDLILANTGSIRNLVAKGDGSKVGKILTTEEIKELYSKIHNPDEAYYDGELLLFWDFDGGVNKVVLKVDFEDKKRIYNALHSGQKYKSGEIENLLKNAKKIF